MADPSLGQLIDNWNQAQKELGKALDFAVYDLSDYRDESWNGNMEYPKWGVFVDEWDYSGYGRHSFKRDGLSFISMGTGTGDNTLGVFSDAHIEEHEEC